MPKGTASTNIQTGRDGEAGAAPAWGARQLQDVSSIGFNISNPPFTTAFFRKASIHFNISGRRIELMMQQIPASAGMAHDAKPLTR
jgi:hypothetical protein